MKMQTETLLILIAIGFLAGMLSRFVGIGGGLLIVPALVIVLGMTQFEAQGTSLAMMLPPIGVFAVINYAKTGNVNWNFALILVLSFVIGGYLGSKFTLSLSPQLVKKIFGVLMLIAAVKLIFSK